MNIYHKQIKKEFLNDPNLTQKTLGFVMTLQNYEIIYSIIKEYDFGKALEKEDVMQEFIFNLIKNNTHPELNYSTYRTTPYLKLITYRFCTDLYRYEKRRANEDITLPNYFNSILIDEDVNGETKVDFEIACSFLPRRLREVMDLQKAGYSHNEISEKLNIKISTSRKRLQRARERLREILKKEYSN